MVSNSMAAKNWMKLIFGVSWHHSYLYGQPRGSTVLLKMNGVLVVVLKVEFLCAGKIAIKKYRNQTHFRVFINEFKKADLRAISIFG